MIDLTDRTVSLLVGLGGGVVTLLGTAIPLLFKFLDTQQQIRKDIELARIEATKAANAAATSADAAAQARELQEEHAQKMNEAMRVNTMLTKVAVNNTKAAVEQIKVANDINTKILDVQGNIENLQKQIIPPK